MATFNRIISSINQALASAAWAGVGMLVMIGLASVSATAQIMPSQPPVDTAVGGTGASRESLLRISGRSGVKILQNLRGPEKGWGRARSEVQVHPVTDQQVPGVEGYFLRSSYVTLDPGGVAPIHSHARRPAFLQVISGSVHQHRSDGVSLVMGPGDFTFSSDDLAHWWINEDSKEPMKLWVVELCSAAHGCKTAVDGGAMVVLGEPATSSTAAQLGGTKVETVMKIDLPGEFSGVKTLGNRHLRLRKIRVPQGASPGSYGEAESLTYFRVASGELTRRSSGKETKVKEGSIVLANHAPVGPAWSNASKKEAVIFAIDIYHPEP